MNEARCAWCGERIEKSAGAPSFCDKICQRAHEEWCCAQAVARTRAVFRWRDMQVAEIGDLLNDLLTVGARPETYFASIRVRETVIEGVHSREA